MDVEEASCCTAVRMVMGGNGIPLLQRLDSGERNEYNNINRSHRVHSVSVQNALWIILFIMIVLITWHDQVFFVSRTIMCDG